MARGGSRSSDNVARAVARVPLQQASTVPACAEMGLPHGIGASCVVPDRGGRGSSRRCRAEVSARTLPGRDVRPECCGADAKTHGCERRWEQNLLDTFNSGAPIARSLGMRLAFGEDKSAVVSLAHCAQLSSAARPPRQTGLLHGGMYGVVADTAGEDVQPGRVGDDAHGLVHRVLMCKVPRTGWFASARSRSPGSWPLTTTLTLHFQKVRPDGPSYLGV